MTTHLFTLDNIGPRGPTTGEAFVAPTAVLIGDVQIEADVSIWFGAILRADDATIYLGTGSNVQDNCVLHVDRKIDADGVADLEKAAELYRLRWRRFAGGLQSATLPVGITTLKGL